MARKKTSMGAVLIHTILVLLTGGLWLIPLIIMFLRSNSR